MAQVPVEVFELITSFLDRTDIKNLRLVSREIEAKVSPQYFRNVVVPFRSELYTSLSQSTSKSPASASASDLFSNGMYIFKSFGPHMRRFALSLELDEESLAYPPIKPTQKAVPTFWGIYRWPHDDYHRYSGLHGLEETADEMAGMKAALAHLTKVHSLGLCCDAGLGFLHSPDHLAREARTRVRVFSDTNWRRNKKSLKTPPEPCLTVTDFNGALQKRPVYPDIKAFRRDILEKMAIEAGFLGPQTEEAMARMLETEGVDLENINLDDNLYPAALADSADVGSSARKGKALEKFPLVPNQLSRAQKELLLEVGWAQAAMVQSYVLSIIDNASVGCFSSLTTFAVAKIPSGQLSTLCRQDFWTAIPTLKNFSLGVIADWRQVASTAPGHVEYRDISPVESVSKVYELLSSFVGPCDNIESVHFEWICGGEFAPGVFQRNAYILPAPFFKRAELMAAATAVRDASSKLLQLPHVKHLSLKNCWSSPHVCLQMIRQLALGSLEKLDLESFSLSGTPTNIPQDPLLAAWIFPFAEGLTHTALTDETDEDDYEAIQNEGQADASGAPDLLSLHEYAAASSSSHSDPELVDYGDLPNLFTWSGLIIHFSHRRVREILAEQLVTIPTVDPAKIAAWDAALSKFIPRGAELRNDKAKYGLNCLSLKSCGYVAVDAPFIDTYALLPGLPDRPGQPSANVPELKLCMQSCQDSMLAKVIPFIQRDEQSLLFALRMIVGWDEFIYPKCVIDDAIRDGFRPGEGRFSGII
ncbi:F-box domain containing protein [Moelleriella libera RCEF 2490]|uniref:F-box domain containing protein n=1 Tax=Moelleriella libera RCEF 2490 TaxID=1081109 RepID=A0A162IWG3_9HYPO|nr:F-box domain containing protein [Moelleriella libera RCEF 2490]